MKKNKNKEYTNNVYSSRKIKEGIISITAATAILLLISIPSFTMEETPDRTASISKKPLDTQYVGASILEMVPTTEVETTAEVETTTEVESTTEVETTTEMETTTEEEITTEVETVTETVETPSITEEVPSVEESVCTETTSEIIQEVETVPETIWEGQILTRSLGTIQGPSGKETYYNLNMNGVVNIMRNMGYDEVSYPYWERSDGCKMLGDYIMVAADLTIRPRGSLIETSLGTAMVCDTGAFTQNNQYQLDIAVNW